MYKMYQPIAASNYSYNDPRPNLPSPRNPIDGTSGSDVIQGTARNDEISGRDGVDYLYGNQGDDIIRTGGYNSKGNHTMLADDYAWGGIGDDSLYGDINRDFLDGGYNNDVLVGAGGNDWLVGGKGKDELWGGQGADVFAFYDIYEMQGDVIQDFSQLEGDTLGVGTPIAQANGGVVIQETLVNGRFPGVQVDFMKTPTAEEPWSYTGTIYLRGLNFEEAWDILF